MAISKAKQAEKTEAIERLRKWVKPGDEVYCILRHRAASGMSRTISLIVFKDGSPLFISYNAAKATGYRFHKDREGIVIGGCGMDMGFALVDDLRAALGYEPNSLKHRWL